MESPGGLRSPNRTSLQPPTAHYQRTSLTTDSSDQDDDDDDIPAHKLPSVSPSKRHPLSVPSPHVNQTKRPLSDAARGGIVLYPGSKRPRNGYNMPPPSRESLPRSTPDSSCTPAPIRSRSDSLNSSLGDDVPEGLVSSVNDAIRQAQDHEEQQTQLERALTTDVLEEARSDEVEGTRSPMGDQGSGLPLALPLDSEVLNGVSAETLQLFQATHCAAMSADATPNGAIRTNTEVKAPVDTVLPPPGDIWDVPCSPGQQSAQQTAPEGRTENTPPPVKKRGRPPKPSGNEKKILGRPRKDNPRLRDGTYGDYITHIARLRKKPIPCFSDSDAQLPRQPFPVPNGASPVQYVGTNASEQIIQDNDAPTPAHVSVATRGQEPDISRVQFYPCFDGNNYQFAPSLSLAPKTVPEGDSGWAINHAEGSSREGNLDEGSKNLECDDNVVQEELIESGHDECADHHASEDDGMISDFIDGFNSDPGSYRNADQSAEDSFAHDVNAFNASRTHHYEEDENFEDPVDDDVLSIHIDPMPLKRLYTLLGNAAWAGVKRGWQRQDFDYDDAKTEPARALLPLLTKLERLYLMAPRAPDLKAQNKFLREHGDMLRYYFCKIRMVVEYIRSERLELPERNEVALNTDPRKRKRMEQDLVLYVIPMLAHVLVSGWDLGGEKWTKTSFTIATVELLKRTLGWIVVLHRRLLGELESCPLEEEPETERKKQLWRTQNEKRKEIGPLLEKLCQVLSAAPDQLAEVEARAEMELQRREERLRQEEQLEIERKAAEEARQALVAEQKKRSLLSIRGIHYRLRPPTPASRPSPTATPRPAEWSLEEQNLLFLRIQAAYPACPDLNNIRWELNKTLAQTVAMTEKILEKMLTKVLVGYSAEERAAELRRIMHSSGAVES
ncbi:hypothetical protein ANO14919_115300 [Xylariales sp. No.14919]|nr:hypothetical protein ANO14919_115300 [Xylariales sp. No.14919]